jgi:hypothetical protein
MPDNETAAIPVDEPVKPSKLKRIKDVAITTGIIVIPVALSAASVYSTPPSSTSKPPPRTPPRRSYQDENPNHGFSFFLSSY